MLETLFLKTAKSLLSEYVFGFKDDDLEVSILKGKAGVYNSLLNTKKIDEVFEAYDLPFKLKLGFVEEIELDVGFLV